MKRITFIYFLIACIGYSLPTQAQFFKKLKKAVKNTAGSISTEIQDGHEPGAANTGGGYTVNGTNTDLSPYHAVDVYRLQPGEKFDFTESCLAIHAGISSAQVVIFKGGKRYFIGTNGQRIPVTDNNIKGCPANFETNADNVVKFTSFAYSAPNVDEDASDRYDDLYVHSSSGVSGNFQMIGNLTVEQQKKMQDMADKMSEEQENGGSVDTASLMKLGQLAQGIHSQGSLHYDEKAAGSFINFNHKSYGPYAIVQSMLVNKAHNKFVAIVTPGEPDMPMSPEPYSLLINSEGLKKKYTFKSGTLLPYGDFNHYRIMISKLNEIVLFDPNTGQRIPVINKDEDNILINKATGTLVQNTGNKIYLDGRLAQTLPAGESVNMRNIFISNDHKRCAVWTADGLFLSSGKMIDGVVSCSAQMQQNNRVLNWIVLGHDNKTLYLCHEAL